MKHLVFHNDSLLNPGVIALFGKKKTQEPVTPQELSKFNDKSTANPLVKKFHASTDSADITGLKKRRFWLRTILGSALTVLLILFLVSMLISKWGDLIIEIDRPLQNRGIVLSEDPDFKEKSVSLSAKQAQNVTNMTYSWLPTDLDTSKNGEHNGKNYVAYTFYCKNEGDEEIDYDAVLDITGVAKSADEAARVMVYKNGKPQVYAKGQYEKREQPETDATIFVNDKTVMGTKTEKFKPGDVDKYTIVIWIEGKDSECVDEIRDGWVRMRMLFEVLDDEDATKTAFGDFYNGEIEEDTNNYNE